MQFKKNFLAGILVTLPSALTLFVFYWLATKIDSLGSWIFSLINSQTVLPVGFGFVGTLLLIYSVGLVASNFAGRRLLGIYEKLLEKIPFINPTFGMFKKIFEMLLSSDRQAFKQPVLVQFPRPGVYTLGLMSSPATKEIQDSSGRDLIGVLVPATPPASGILIFVPKEEIIPLQMSVEEATKIVLSGGLLTKEVQAGMPPA